MAIRLKQPSVLPGFGLTMGYTLTYLSLIVLIPLTALFVKTGTLTWSQFWTTVTEPDVMASYRLTFGAALIAALVNVVFGFIVAWTLVRYTFPGKRIVDAMVDLPFALPTAVSGIALAVLYSEHGWLGKWFHMIGIKTAYSQLGVVIAMTFIGLPFVVRTLQPALEELEKETEEAAASLGATRWQTFTRVIFPILLPATITGFALAFARAVGEYGSVIFIAGNRQGETEITSLRIMIKLDQHDYAGATAIAIVMLVTSFVMLLAINLLQWWAGRRHRKAG